jgi:hypothetical protein
MAPPSLLPDSNLGFGFRLWPRHFYLTKPFRQIQCVSQRWEPWVRAVVPKPVSTLEAPGKLQNFLVPVCRLQRLGFHGLGVAWVLECSKVSWLILKCRQVWETLLRLSPFEHKVNSFLRKKGRCHANTSIVIPSAVWELWLNLQTCVWVTGCSRMQVTEKQSGRNSSMHALILVRDLPWFACTASLLGC